MTRRLWIDSRLPPARARPSLQVPSRGPSQQLQAEKSRSRSRSRSTAPGKAHPCLSKWRRSCSMVSQRGEQSPHRQSTDTSQPAGGRRIGTYLLRQLSSTKQGKARHGAASHRFRSVLVAQYLPHFCPAACYCIESRDAITARLTTRRPGRPTPHSSSEAWLWRPVLVAAMLTDTTSRVSGISDHRLPVCLFAKPHRDTDRTWQNRSTAEPGNPLRRLQPHHSSPAIDPPPTSIKTKKASVDCRLTTTDQPATCRLLPLSKIRCGGVVAILCLVTITTCSIGLRRKTAPSVT